MEKISLIIPTQNNSAKLIELLTSISTWTLLPDQIIIVDSSEIKIEISLDFQDFCKINNIFLNIIYEKNLFPGNARNKGIANSKYDYLAFLDINTMPNENWLKSNFTNLINSRSHGIIGATIYKASNSKEKIIRAATYGTRPLKTLPGSIFKKDVINRCGLFIESVRAGEDQDWMVRLNLHKIQTINSKEILTYNGLLGFNYIDILKKWFRNYYSASNLPYLRSHKDWYFYGISIVLITIAFNWNVIMTNRFASSVFYIPHITKISVIFLTLLYIVLRGIYYPLNKGLKLNFIFPFNFLKLVALSFALDTAKLVAFIIGKLKK